MALVDLDSEGYILHVLYIEPQKLVVRGCVSFFHLAKILGSSCSFSGLYSFLVHLVVDKSVVKIQPGSSILDGCFLGAGISVHLIKTYLPHL